MLALRIHKRPGHPGSPDVLSANRFLHFRRYSEACFGRRELLERFVCQVYAYFRSYYSGFYHYIPAFSNYLPTHHFARPTTKRHLAGDCLSLSFQPNWGGVIIYSVFTLHRLLLSIYPAKSPIYSTIDSRVGVSTLGAHFFLLAIEIGERGIRKWNARRRALFRPKGANLFDLESDLD